MFQVQARTTSIPLSLTIPFCYWTNQSSTLGSRGLYKTSGRRYLETAELFQAFHISWTCCGSPMCFHQLTETCWGCCSPLFPCCSFQVLPSPSAGICWIPLSCPRKTSQSKVNLKKEKLFNFWPAQLPEPVCVGPEDGARAHGAGQQNHISPDEGCLWLRTSRQFL